MWRLFNSLFGWHYVWVVDCGTEGIYRVKKAPNGYLVGCIVARNFWIDKDGLIQGGYRINDWRPLTWEQKNLKVKNPDGVRRLN